MAKIQATLREATPSDMPHIVRLLWDDDIGRKREAIGPDTLHRYREAFEAIAADPKTKLLVTIEDDVIVGCVHITCIPGMSYQGAWRCLIEDLRVAPQARRRGVGRLLMQAAEEQARLAGCGLMELFVHEERASAQAFYRHLGFSGVHRG
jgi:GNAT superfamily N-acetyltransferase